MLTIGTAFLNYADYAYPQNIGINKVCDDSRNMERSHKMATAAQINPP